MEKLGSTAWVPDAWGKSYRPRDLRASPPARLHTSTVGHIMCRRRSAPGCHWHRASGIAESRPGIASRSTGHAMDKVRCDSRRCQPFLFRKPSSIVELSNSLSFELRRDPTYEARASFCPAGADSDPECRQEGPAQWRT